MIRPAAKKAAGILVAMLLVQAVLLNGVCLLKMPAVGKAGGQSSLMTLDVCGKGVLQASLDGFESINIKPSIFQYFPSISVIHPEPEPAVASAGPGEEDKPPEN